MPERDSNNRGGDGPRAVLRVPEVLMAVAANAKGMGFAELCERLGLPKSSLHRLLQTLEQGAYLVRRNGLYALGPATTRMIQKLAEAAPAEDYPRSVRPILEWLAHESGESVILAELTRDRCHVHYLDVINSPKPLRFTVPLGHTRPLYAAAAGQIMLAYLPVAERERYLAEAEFTRLTEETLGPDELAARLPAIVAQGFAFERNGSFIGAGAVASACFDASGQARYAVSVAGPVERLEAAGEGLCESVLEAGRRISQVLGHRASYPLGTDA